MSKHSKHSKPKKRSPLPVIIGAAVLVLALAAVFVFFVRPTLARLKIAPVPEVPAETEEVIEEPEPVDMREYDLHYPESSNEAIAAVIDSVSSSIMEEFCGRYDGQSPAFLRTSYIMGSSDEVFSFILVTDMNGDVSRKTWCISQDGAVLTAEEALGENFAQYLSDYVDLFYYTDRWDFNDDGVMVLYKDISEAVSPEAGNFPLFLLNSGGGVEFVILPEAVAEGMELHIHEPVTLPEKISYSSSDAEIPKEETTDAEEPALPDGEVPAGDEVPAAETPAVETPAVEASAPEENAETVALGETAPSPGLSALAEELGGFAVVADTDVLNGNLLSYRRLYPNKPMVALTFDDGPSELYTMPILEILKSYGVVATFYEVGVNVERLPGLVQKELEYGCEVGSHSYYHYVFGEQSYDFLVQEHALADQAFLNAIGFVPKTVRPPQGDVMGFTQVVYKEPLIGWSIDTLDWLYKDPNYNLRTVKNAGNLDGQVILLHSIHPTSLESVEPIVQYILSEGYQMVTISELLKYGYLIDTPQPAFYYQVDFFSKGRPAYPAEEEILEEADITPEEPVTEEAAPEEPVTEETAP